MLKPLIVWLSILFVFLDRCDIDLIYKNSVPQKSAYISFIIDNKLFIEVIINFQELG